MKGANQSLAESTECLETPSEMPSLAMEDSTGAMEMRGPKIKSLAGREAGTDGGEAMAMTRTIFTSR